MVNHVANHFKSAKDHQEKRWLLQTADALKLPDGPEFRSAFLAYLEWGTLIKLYKLRYHRLHSDFWIRQSVLWLNDDVTFYGTLV